MKWFKRGCWIAAWGLWAWLGVGLARELPRDLGPVVAELSLDGREEAALGFLAGEHQLVCKETRNKGRPTIIRIRDAKSGQIVRGMDGPIDFGGRICRWWCNWQPWMIAERRPKIPGRKDAESSSALDLRTGEWTDLSFQRIDDAVFHPTRAWAALSKPSDELDSCGRVIVVDLVSGKELFEWKGRPKLSPGRQLRKREVFVSDTSIAVPTMTSLAEKKADAPDDDRLEVWSIPAGSEPAGEFLDVKIGDDPIGSLAGRIAWHDALNAEGWIDVFDVVQRRLLFSYPPNRGKERTASSGFWSGLAFSRDGRGVYGQTAAKLWDVNSGRELWSRRERQQSRDFQKWEQIRSVTGDAVFEVHETWFAEGDFEINLETYAVRSLSDGRLLYRCKGPTAPPNVLVSSDGALTYEAERHLIRLLPPIVNWPLLAICQSILALPLIILWAILRWRRNRRLRLASVQP